MDVPHCIVLIFLHIVIKSFTTKFTFVRRFHTWILLLDSIHLTMNSKRQKKRILRNLHSSIRLSSYINKDIS